MDAEMKLCTIDEAADALRVSASTVRRLIIAGKIKAVRVGRSIRIQKREIERFVATGGVR